MSNVYSAEAQDNINAAENKLGDAINQLRNQSKSDETNIEIIPDNKPDVEVVIEDKQPRRTEFVKTDDPKVQERINDLYRQVKGSDARNQMIIEHNKQLEQKLTEYHAKLSKFEQETKAAAASKVEGELKTALRNAREEGDFDKMDELDGKLQLLREERLKSTLISQQEQVTKKPQEQQFNQQEVHTFKYLTHLAAEKDSQGNQLRPYLEDWHPDNDKVIEMFSSIPKEFAAAGKKADLRTVMDVIDERMRGKKQPANATVLSGDGDAPVKNTIKLTAAEVEIAHRMGIKPERYAYQKQFK